MEYVVDRLFNLSVREDKYQYCCTWYSTGPSCQPEQQKGPGTHVPGCTARARMYSPKAQAL
jgi:hypothetical protein